MKVLAGRLSALTFSLHVMIDTAPPPGQLLFLQYFFVLQQRLGVRRAHY